MSQLQNRIEVIVKMKKKKEMKKKREKVGGGGGRGDVYKEWGGSG